MFFAANSTMKMNLAWNRIGAGLIAAIALGSSNLLAGDFKVATSIYPGWMDNWLMEMKLVKGEPTFLEKRLKEAGDGSRVKIEKFKEYIPSVEALVAGKVDACTMTLGEALGFPADSGVPVVILLVDDYSNGNDGVLVPKGWTLDKMAGKSIVAEEFSCSQYLIYRWMQKEKKPINYLKLKNTPGDDVSKVFLAAVGTSDEVAGATWNPHVLRIMQSGKADLAFNSHDIPGEIVDCVVVRKDRIAGNEKAIKAYIDAHYDVMEYFTNPKTRDRAIKAMANAAEFSGDDAPLYSKMLEATRFFTNRAETIKFMESPEFAETQVKVRGFLKEFGAFKSPDPDKVSVAVDPGYLK